MMELLNTMSDDQIAMSGCVAALIICGLVMSLSFYVGQFFNNRQTKRVTTPIRNHNPRRDVRTGKAA